jgi:hypothetical protein
MRLSSNILSVTAGILASFMTRGADALTLEERYCIEFRENILYASFDNYYKDREVQYRL